MAATGPNDDRSVGANDEWVTLALVRKTQGRRGEVAVELHTDVPDRFSRGMRLWALGKAGERRKLTVEDFWPHKEFLVLKFAGVETISDAETLKAAELQVPLAERAKLEPGWTYLSDLIGSVVFDGNREVGRIAEVTFGAGEAPLLVVRGEPGDTAKLPCEIPFAEAYLVNVNVEQKQVRMRLPEGMLDVNAPLKKEESR
jgi:16S rRNA processing protein RimM